MSNDSEARVHWTEHIDADGHWVKRVRACDYCAILMASPHVNPFGEWNMPKPGEMTKALELDLRQQSRSARQPRR